MTGAPQMPSAPGGEIATIERSNATIGESDAKIEAFYATADIDMLKPPLLILQLPAQAIMTTAIHPQFSPIWRNHASREISRSISQLICCTCAVAEPSAPGASEFIK
jgi:hypothetical protein